MKVQIKTNAIKAAVLCAAKKDIRYYFNGVLLDFRHETKTLNIVATNGHYLLATRNDLIYIDGEQTADFQMIVPREIAEHAAKCKASTVALESMPDGRYMLAGQVFAPVAGTFPDYYRVIPRHETMQYKGQPGQFDSEYLALGQKAIRAFYGDKKLYLTMTHDGKHAGVMHAGHNDCVFVVMPVTPDRNLKDGVHEYTGFYLA